MSDDPTEADWFNLIEASCAAVEARSQARIEALEAETARLTDALAEACDELDDACYLTADEFEHHAAKVEALLSPYRRRTSTPFGAGSSTPLEPPRDGDA